MCNCKELTIPYGPQGAQGIQGTPGTNGTDGIDGTNGTDGTNGINGTNGTNGINGTNGTNGTNGVSIVWQGSLASAPVIPSLNWGYYDTVLLKSYIWDGISWEIISQDGINGTNGGNGFLYETEDGNLTPAEATGLNQILRRNLTDTGYEFVDFTIALQYANSQSRCLDFNKF